MKYKNREKSNNIIDKRTPSKIRNNKNGDKSILKLFNTITKSNNSKTKKKNIDAKKNKKPLSSTKFTKMDR